MTRASSSEAMKLGELLFGDPTQLADLEAAQLAVLSR
jgi:hypothetical protein